MREDEKLTIGPFSLNRKSFDERVRSLETRVNVLDPNRYSDAYRKLIEVIFENGLEKTSVPEIYSTIKSLIIKRFSAEDLKLRVSEGITHFESKIDEAVKKANDYLDTIKLWAKAKKEEATQTISKLNIEYQNDTTNVLIKNQLSEERGKYEVLKERLNTSVTEAQRKVENMIRALSNKKCLIEQYRKNIELYTASTAKKEKDAEQISAEIANRLEDTINEALDNYKKNSELHDQIKPSDAERINTIITNLESKIQNAKNATPKITEDTNMLESMIQGLDKMHLNGGLITPEQAEAMKQEFVLKKVKALGYCSVHSLELICTLTEGEYNSRRNSELDALKPEEKILLEKERKNLMSSEYPKEFRDVLEVLVNKGGLKTAFNTHEIRNGKFVPVEKAVYIPSTEKQGSIEEYIKEILRDPHPDRAIHLYLNCLNNRFNKNEVKVLINNYEQVSNTIKSLEGRKVIIKRKDGNYHLINKLLMVMIPAMNAYEERPGKKVWKKRTLIDRVIEDYAKIAKGRLTDDVIRRDVNNCVDDLLSSGVFKREITSEQNNENLYSEIKKAEQYAFKTATADLNGQNIYLWNVFEIVNDVRKEFSKIERQDNKTLTRWLSLLENIKDHKKIKFNNQEVKPYISSATIIQNAGSYGTSEDLEISRLYDTMNGYTMNKLIVQKCDDILNLIYNNIGIYTQSQKNLHSEESISETYRKHMGDYLSKNRTNLNNTFR